MNFWQELRARKNPILGLSPMDGVTDAPYRRMICETSQPDLIMTEFVNVEGLARGAVRMLDDFVYSEIERPVIAQIYGIEIESFYQVAMMACYLGFDGIDINMGCPAKKVAHRGAGAGLIQNPEHAKKIIRRVKEAVKDFVDGKTLRDAGVREKCVLAIEKKNPSLGKGKLSTRKKIPVSVKTRMGYDEIVVEHWMEHLLEESPAAITLHGRTLKQGYSGDANWEIIAKAGEIIQKNSPETLFLGNGDIKSLEDAKEKIFTSNIDGALVGRATYGNPWFFSGEEANEEQRKYAAIRHSEIFEEIFPDRPFFIMRKHLGWYMKNFSGAREYRKLLMAANSTDDVRKILG